MAEVSTGYQKLEEGPEKKDDPGEEPAKPAQATEFGYIDYLLTVLNFTFAMFLCYYLFLNRCSIDNLTHAIDEENAELDRMATALEHIANKNTASLAYELLRQKALK